jgi:hypothetical protein
MQYMGSSGGFGFASVSASSHERAKPSVRLSVRAITMAHRPSTRFSPRGKALSIKVLADMDAQMQADVAQLVGALFSGVSKNQQTFLPMHVYQDSSRILPDRLTAILHVYHRGDSMIVAGSDGRDDGSPSRF